MQLLGNYQSNLTAFLYAQLLGQLNTAISQGQYAAGALFDTTAAQAIQAEGQNFTTITVPSAGDTAYANDMNTPLDSLQARYTAIANEIASVQQQIPALLALIDKEATLIDMTMAAAEVETWGSQQPPLPTAQVSLWNFESGHGVTSQTYPTTDNATYQTDPNNGVAYILPVAEVSYIINEALDGDGTIIQGIGTPIIRRTLAVNSLNWIYTPNSPETQFEEIYDEDQTWAYLTALEPNPILTFGPPNVNVVLPLGGSAAGLFQVSGSVPGGVLPVYVRILFYPRQNSVVIPNAVANQVVQLSLYNVTVDTVQVFTSTTVYLDGVDYTVSDLGALTVLSSGSIPGNTITVLFEEYYPAYQCSIDQKNWSPIFMLDPNRPYPDNTTNFYPINIQNGQFPLFDELGVPVGLYMEMIGTPNQEMELQVITPAASTFGENVQLSITMQQPTYMNGLQLTPFTNFPMVIQSITAYGFTSNIVTVVLDIPVVLTESAIIKFPRQLVSSFTINFYQQNYSLKEYIAPLPDALRRQTLQNLQAVLPFSVQTPPGPVPQYYEGAMYEFGVEDIVGIDDQYNNPGVFVSGPYLVTGDPEVIRLDANLFEMPQLPTPAVYLAYIAYNGADAILEQNEIAYTPGTTIVYPGVYTADHVDFFVKFVFRENLSVAQEFQLQVTVT